MSCGSGSRKIRKVPIGQPEYAKKYLPSCPRPENAFIYLKKKKKKKQTKPTQKKKHPHNHKFKKNL